MACKCEQIIAPEGYFGLAKGRDYYYLGRVDSSGLVMLCSFNVRKKHVYLEYIESDLFEAGLLAGNIVSRDPQRQYPEWLDRLFDSDASENEQSIQEYKKKHKKLVKKRYKRIKKLRKKQRVYLQEKNPLRAIKSYARKNKLNAQRTCFEFFCVVAFNNSRWALLPAYLNAGTYERNITESSAKVGPKYKDKGNDFGYPRTPEMTEKILQGYDLYSGPGEFLTDIYEEIVRKKFKCKQRLDANDNWEFYQPNNKPFPSEAQVNGAIIKKHGRDKVQTDRLGEQATRNKKRPSKGKFSQNVANLMERGEGDGYFLKEVPKGERDGEPMRPLCTVRYRDYACGGATGIGFSIGGETKDAYRSAVFCMAIEKSEFGRLFGMKISDEEWPSIGLPSWLSLDHGPGASEDLLKENFEEISIRDMAPSYAGQSKAVVESSHPRKAKVAGRPTFMQSNLTYTQLGQREIQRTVADWVSTDVVNRLTPDMLRAGVAGNPLSIWKYMDDRLRNDARRCSYSSAIRNFLTPAQVKIDESGAYVHGMRYHSSMLHESDLCRKAVMDGGFWQNGFILPLSMRQVWIDYDGYLIEVEAQLEIRDNEDQLFISLSDLEELERLRNKASRGVKGSRRAAIAEYKDRFEIYTGKSWDSGTLKTGDRQRGTAAAKAEFEDYKRITTGKR